MLWILVWELENLHLPRELESQRRRELEDRRRRERETSGVSANEAGGNALEGDAGGRPNSDVHWCACRDGRSGLLAGVLGEAHIIV
jgi:hypothetical protein